MGPFVGAIFGVLVHWILFYDWDPKLGFSKKKNTTNEISNDNNGLNDAALRVGA